ncbi:hypothetical protein HGRIS_003562 [Hohenbuehelia grisea]|uniref:ABC transmembrane type-1 domain-containing protein n=1 Tax=Hohenbuehelia grisea TaxID=104357 RepID=A0ABR3JGS6_9AGAR
MAEKDAIEPIPSTEKDGSLQNSKPHSAPLNLQLDTGIEQTRFRQSWWQFWIPRNPPPPPRASLDDAPVMPLATATPLSKLTYTWITDIMVLGYQRTLQASDLWKMHKTQQSGLISAKLDDAWARRVKEADEWNHKLDSGALHPSLLREAIWSILALAHGWRFHEHRIHLRQRWYKVDARRSPSLAMALNDTLGSLFWIGGAFKVFGDTTQLMGPLLVKAIINFGKERVASLRDGSPVPDIGRGIAMAIGLFFIVIITSISQHQFFWRSMSTGVLARGALISSIYKRGVHLTGKSRTQIPNSALINHISTDVSRIDSCAQWFHPGMSKLSL